MFSNKILLMVATGMQLSLLYAGSKKVEKKTIVQNCTGYSSQCLARIGAAGDVVKFSVSDLTPKFLGKITEEKQITIEFPPSSQPPKDRTLYSLIPSQGESAGKLIFVVFKNVMPPADDEKLAGKTIIYAYRRFESEPADKWTEVSRIFSDAAIEPTPITFKQDGTAVWTDQSTGKQEVFQLGRINLRETKPAATATATTPRQPVR